MKETGIVRRIDDLGRISIPIELRKALGIAAKEQLEIYVEGSAIMLKKYCAACVICSSAMNTTLFKDWATPPLLRAWGFLQTWRRNTMFGSLTMIAYRRVLRPYQTQNGK